MRTKVFTDELTGLGNRRLLLEHLEDLAERPGSTYAVLAIDLDRFKHVNDTFGHFVGDELLTVIASRIRAVLRDIDLAARVGGDEFTIVLPAVDLDQTIGVAQRVLAELRLPVLLSAGTVAIDGSIGLACSPQHTDSPTDLLRFADSAMYLAKRDGTGIEVFQNTETDVDRGNRILFQEFRRSGLIGELALYFQPKVSLSDGIVRSVEALVRWQHPERGILAPSEFLPACEGTSMMRRVTSWVLEQALAQLSKWDQLGLSLSMAINISAGDLDDLALPELTAAALAHHDVAPQRLTFEITETSLITTPARAAEVTRPLHVLGVQISLDDFGTGYSSLSHLKQFPLTELKLDRHFVTELDNPSAALIVASITQMAHALGLTVVAEGVESDSLRERLELMGCDIAQGFHWSEPLPAESFEEWLRDYETQSNPKRNVAYN